MIFGCVGMLEAGVYLERQKRELCRIEELELFVVGSFQRFGGKEGPGGEVGLDVSHSKHLSKDTHYTRHCCTPKTSPQVITSLTIMTFITR